MKTSESIGSQARAHSPEIIKDQLALTSIMLGASKKLARIKRSPGENIDLSSLTYIRKNNYS